MVFMYVMNFVWVFRDQGALQFDARFLKFLLVGIVSITCNMAVLSLIVSAWATDPFWTQILLLPAIVAFNFLAMKYFSFALDAKAAREKGRQR
jgi:putative flippase GtrA